MPSQKDNFGSNKQQSGRSSHEDSGDMSVREAGHKGGQRVRELVEEGKEAEGQGGRQRSDSDR